MTKGRNVKKLLLWMLVLSIGCIPIAGAEEDDVSAFFWQPADILQMDLALLSAYACQASYSRRGAIDYLAERGFDQIAQYDDQTTAAHSAAMTMGHRLIRDDQGRETTLYAVIVRGTLSMQEGISNLYLGDGDMAAGFQLAAERALGHINAYMEAYPPAEEGQYCLWLCGHSRGGAVVNLLAAQYLPEMVDQERVYAYTFGTPNVQKHPNQKAWVYNFILDMDPLARLPFEEWGYGRNGQDIYLFLDRSEAEAWQEMEHFMKNVLQRKITLDRYLQLTMPIFDAMALHPDIDPMLFVGAVLPMLNADELSIEFDVDSLIAWMNATHLIDVYIDQMNKTDFQ